MALAMVRLQLRSGVGFSALIFLRAAHLLSSSDRLLVELLERRLDLSSPDTLLLELHEWRGGNLGLPCDTAVCVET